MVRSLKKLENQPQRLITNRSEWLISYYTRENGLLHTLHCGITINITAIYSAFKGIVHILMGQIFAIIYCYSFKVVLDDGKSYLNLKMGQNI